MDSHLGTLDWDNIVFEAKRQHKAPAAADVALTVLQTRSTTHATALIITTIMPADNTLPMITEGGEILSYSFTPESSTSTLLISVAVMNFDTESNGSPRPNWALFDGNDCILAGAEHVNWNKMAFTFPHATGDINTHIFSFRMGPTARSNLYVNRDRGGELFGTASKSSMVIMEVEND